MNTAGKGRRSGKANIKKASVSGGERNLWWKVAVSASPSAQRRVTVAVTPRRHSGLGTLPIRHSGAEGWRPIPGHVLAGKGDSIDAQREGEREWRASGLKTVGVE